MCMKTNKSAPFPLPVAVRAAHLSSSPPNKLRYQMIGARLLIIVDNYIWGAATQPKKVWHYVSKKCGQRHDLERYNLYIKLRHSRNTKIHSTAVELYFKVGSDMGHKQLAWTELWSFWFQPLPWCASHAKMCLWCMIASSLECLLVDFQQSPGWYGEGIESSTVVSEDL
ncbi:uncharacterized protein BJ212DRAFT_1294492 [Suillus subaureus]|uniref:Uncharacterized protein n=1 Tax=Suillus subaureus TaxID=48587 RepID=A0A9P7JKA4_9AGAM|nr:uncharacterized protein BJ212DRAFT_1294492 [Suillus subaureus]KAG1827142.1 hypothetical protein BJ212DRAFT_1294492 [Suillus subaureus]